MAPPIALASLQAVVVAFVLSGCAAAPAQRPSASSTPRPKTVAAADADERPRAVELTEEELFVAGLDGCQVSATHDDPLVAYCPEAIFGVNTVRRAAPDTLFNEWLEEIQPEGAPMTVLERHQEKLFGPTVTALRLILRHPRAAQEATNLVYVALVDVDGELRRVWCSTPSYEPAGIARCQQGLLSAARARLH